MEILNKTYSSEELSDVERDVYESFDGDFNECIKEIPVDKHGFSPGIYTVKITWESKPDGDNE